MHGPSELRGLICAVICCTRMENPKGTLQGTGTRRSAGQRRIELRCASIQVDSTGLRRIAEYSDGSVKTAGMKWDDVRRVAAFKRDVLTSGVLCLALTDSANVIILDESMEGWNGLVAALPDQVPGAPDAGEWRSAIVAPSEAANWTVLFRAQ